MHFSCFWCPAFFPVVTVIKALFYFQSLHVRFFLLPLFPRRIREPDHGEGPRFDIFFVRHRLRLRFLLSHVEPMLTGGMTELRGISGWGGTICAGPHPRLIRKCSISNRGRKKGDTKRCTGGPYRSLFFDIPFWEPETAQPLGWPISFFQESHTRPSRGVTRTLSEQGGRGEKLFIPASTATGGDRGEGEGEGEGGGLRRRLRRHRRGARP